MQQTAPLSDDCWLCVFAYLDTCSLMTLRHTNRAFRMVSDQILEKRERKATQGIIRFRNKVNAGIAAHRTSKKALSALVSGNFAWRGNVGHLFLDAATVSWRCVTARRNNRYNLGAAGDLYDTIVVLGTNIRKVTWTIGCLVYSTSHHLGTRFAVSLCCVPLPVIACLGREIRVFIVADHVSAVYCRVIYCDSNPRRRLAEEILRVPVGLDTFVFGGGICWKE